MSANVVEIDGQRKTFKFGPNLVKRLDAEVLHQERSEADIVRQALAEYLNREDQKRALRQAEIESVLTGQSIVTQ